MSGGDHTLLQSAQICGRQLLHCDAESARASPLEQSYFAGERGRVSWIDEPPSLWLNDNRIENLETGTFDGLANLRTVKLYRNKIAFFDLSDLDRVQEEEKVVDLNMPDGVQETFSLERFIEQF